MGTRVVVGTRSSQVAARAEIVCWVRNGPPRGVFRVNSGYRANSMEWNSVEQRGNEGRVRSALRWVSSNKSRHMQFSVLCVEAVGCALAR